MASGITRTVKIGVMQTLIDVYGTTWETCEPQNGPWPQDPDGGELRLIMALRAAMPHLSDEGVALVADRMGLIFE